MQQTALFLLIYYGRRKLRERNAVDDLPAHPGIENPRCGHKFFVIDPVRFIADQCRELIDTFH